MTGLNRDECSAAGCSDLLVCDQFAFHNSPIIRRFNYACDKTDRVISWSGPQKLYRVVSGDRAGRVVQTVSFHQVPGRGPVAMAVEEGADDAATQHSGKRLLVSFRLEVGYDFIALGEAANVQALFIRRTAPETGKVWSVGFLYAFFSHRLSKVQSLMSDTLYQFVATAGKSDAICYPNQPQ